MSRQQEKLWKSLKQGRATATLASLGDKMEGERWQGGKPGAAEGQGGAAVPPAPDGWLGKVKEFLEPS